MNKPQCETAAQCLKELARVMEQFGFDKPIDAINSEYIKHPYAHEWYDIPNFSSPTEWSFALFELEGKPVFIGDEIYHSSYGIIKVTGIGNQTEIFAGLASDSESFKYFIQSYCSWNPPRKTATISINGGDAVKVDLEDIMVYGDSVSIYSEPLSKALQPLVKEN